MKNPKLMMAGLCVLAAITTQAQGVIVDPTNPNWPPLFGSYGQYPENQHPPVIGLKDPTLANSCTPYAPEWHMGGDNITPPVNNNGSLFLGNLNVYPGGLMVPPPTFEIGTCNDYPFVLKAYDKKSVFVTQSSKVGVGLDNSAPGAALDVKASYADAMANSHFQIFGDADGNVFSTTHMNLTTAGDFKINLGLSVQSPPNVFKIEGATGRVGVGINAFNSFGPLANFEVRDAANAQIYAYTTTLNDAGLWVLNAQSNYGFHVDADKIGHITTDKANNLHLINFKYNYAISHEQVWLGSKPTTGPHVDFHLAVGGKLVAQSVYVTLQGNWADYVFAPDYKLPKLSDVEAYYKANKHLPEMPTALEVAEQGINVGEMNKLLLKKIEELTLYVVEQQKKQTVQEQKIEELKDQLSRIENK